MRFWQLIFFFMAAETCEESQTWNFQQDEAFVYRSDYTASWPNEHDVSYLK